MKPWLAPFACAVLLGVGGVHLRYTRPLSTQQRLSQPFPLQVSPQSSHELALLQFCGTLLQRYGTNLNALALQDILISASLPLKLNDVQYHISVNVFMDKSIEFVLEADINQERGMRFVDKDADGTLDEVAELRLTGVQSLLNGGSSRNYTVLSIALTQEHQAAYRSHLAQVLRAPIPASPRLTYETKSQ